MSTSEVVQNYVYRDADGKPIARIDRHEPGLDGGHKSFTPHLYDRATQTFVKRPGLRGVKLPLYRLPDVRTAITDEEHIYVTEGEGKCDKLRDALQAAGIDAAVTTVAGGANAPLTDAHLESLQGARAICLLTDSDDAGRRAARKRAVAIADHLADVDVRLVDLFPAFDDGSDVADFLAEGGTVEQLHQRVLEARSVEPSATAQAVASREELEQAINDAAKLPPVEYERSRRRTAKTLGIRTSILDDMVASSRQKTTEPRRDDTIAGNERALPQEVIDGARLLNEVVSKYGQYIVTSEVNADALALWTMHAHVTEAADFTPYIFLTSPERRCAKSLVQDVASMLTPNPIATADITTAALFRIIGSGPVTVFIDEVDAIFGAKKTEQNEDLRKLLNAGFERGRPVYRCVPVGKEQIVQPFDVFGPKMLAGIKRKLPDTVLDRCITLEMQRKAKHEKVDRFRRRKVIAGLKNLRERLAAWGRQNVSALTGAEPELPDELNDRAQDIWEPLFAIADRVGGGWPARARAAAIALSGADDAADSISESFLRDIRTVYGDDERLHTQVLLRRLTALPEAPWATWRGGEPINVRSLSELLKPFKIKSRQIWIGGVNRNGYESWQFTDAWSRYVPLPGQADDSGPSLPRALAAQEKKREFEALEQTTTSASKSGAGPYSASILGDLEPAESVI